MTDNIDELGLGHVYLVLLGERVTPQCIAHGACVLATAVVHTYVHICDSCVTDVVR